MCQHSFLQQLNKQLVQAFLNSKWNLVKELINKGEDVAATAKHGPYKGKSVFKWLANNGKFELILKLIYEKPELKKI